MIDASFYAIVLAGGSGTRLWPLSRTLLPKQLMSLDGGKQSLLKYTVSRVLDAFDAQHVYTVTNDEQGFAVKTQVSDIDPTLSEQVLTEPMKRNTLPAILLALNKVVTRDPKAVVAVFPADHQIDANDGWVENLSQALSLARQGRFVTFGITPTKPETSYGYICCGNPIDGCGAYDVLGFVEKPDHATAQAYFESGKYYWNSGIFVFAADIFLQAVKETQPVFWDWWQTRDKCPLTEYYAKLPEISVDYAIAENITPKAMIPASFAWDDLGNWEAIYRIGGKDAADNVIQGDVLALACHDNLLISSGSKLACVGVANMVVVQTRDATLVCPREECQNVKAVVDTLAKEGSRLVESHVTVHRPWGSYTVLEDEAHYKIKRIELPPGGKLSLQMHHHRTEHWVIVQGTALIQIGDKEILLSENQSVDIPKTILHRLSNPGKIPLALIEIQSGAYLDEDDIERYNDVYGRVEHP